jgi:hypothetical protein
MARRHQHALRKCREGPPVKASRKLSPSSFVMQVAGDARGGGALTALTGKGKGGPAGDHDLGHPPGGSSDPDSGPKAGPDGRLP